MRTKTQLVLYSILGVFSHLTGKGESKLPIYRYIISLQCSLDNGAISGMFQICLESVSSDLFGMFIHRLLTMKGNLCKVNYTVELCFYRVNLMCED